MELANFSLFPSIFPPMRVANYFFCAIPVRVLGPYFGGLFSHDLQEHHIVYGTYHTTLYHTTYRTRPPPLPETHHNTRLPQRNRRANIR